MRVRKWMLALMIVFVVIIARGIAQADLAIQGFDSAGQWTFSTLNNGTNYN